MATSQDFFTWTCSEELEPRFLLMCLRARHDDLVGRLAMGSTHKTIYMADIRGLRIPLPPVSEQRRIADFLDLETARIDELVARNRRLHALAEERYLALIDRISDRESLQSVPLKRVAKISYGLGQPPALSSEGVPIIRATNIERGKIRSAGLIFASLSDLPLARSPLLQEGEILVVRSGALTGDSALITAEWAGSAPGYDLRVKPMAIDPGFLAHQLQGRRAQAQIAIMRARAAQPHLNAEDLGEVLVMSGARAEERAAGHELDNARALLDALGSAVEAFTAVMNERSKALTAAAVNGQLDPTSYPSSTVTA